MKQFLVLGFAVLAGLAPAESVLYYGGDYDGDATGEPTCDQIGGLMGVGQDLAVYDFFNLSVDSTITAVFGHFIDTTVGGHAATSARWTIRSGVSSGNGGTMMGSGTIAVTSVDDGFHAQGSESWKYTGRLASGLSLTAGNYWLAMELVETGSNQAFLNTTGGANHVGLSYSSAGRGLSYLTGDNGAVVGGPYNFARTDVDLLSRPSNFSQGVIGNPNLVPEPASWAVLLLGVVAVARGRRRRPVPRQG